LPLALWGEVKERRRKGTDMIDGGLNGNGFKIVSCD
jgi:hypothetical protein